MKFLSCKFNFINKNNLLVVGQKITTKANVKKIFEGFDLKVNLKWIIVHYTTFLKWWFFHLFSNLADSSKYSRTENNKKKLYNRQQ